MTGDRFDLTHRFIIDLETFINIFAVYCNAVQVDHLDIRVRFFTPRHFVRLSLVSQKRRTRPGN